METLEVVDEIPDSAKLGLWGLGGVIGGIVAWDVMLPDKTISNAIREQHDKHPILGRAVTLGVLSGLAIHLCLDEETDPIQKAFNRVMRWKDE